MIKNPSPHLLLQEILWPDRWKSTVACVLLNRTKRGQVDKVWPTLFKEAPDADSLLKMDNERLKEILKPLGLSNMRSSRLLKLATDWKNGVEYDKLHGIGEYTIASDKIFYRGEIPESVEDHALKSYDLFNIEPEGEIPYNEQAKICAIMDMKEMDIEKRKNEAIYVFNDIRDFFENDMRTTYLATVLSKENVHKVLDEILPIFQEMEDYEKCACIVEWKKKLETIKAE
jgi:hypothetical protein